MQLIRFGDLPVQRKMLWLILLICGTVLVVATASLFAFQLYAFRVSFHEDTATLAQIIADNSTVAVGCDDAKAAKQILGSLKAKPYVNTAVIVRANGVCLNPSAGIPGERGVLITLRFWCEEGHSFTYALEFHKGQTYLERRTQVPAPCEPVIWRS